MGLTYIPRNISPWQRQLPNFLANLTYQTMRQKFIKQQENKRQQDREQEELRHYQSRGYREVVGEPGGPGEAGGTSYAKPTLDVGGKSLVEPKTGLEIRKINGKHFIVNTQQKYGESPTVTKATELKKDAAQWEQLDPITIGGNKVYPQKNTITNEIKFNKFSTKKELTEQEKLNLEEGKIQRQIEKEQEMANYKQGLEEITIYNPETKESRKITRDEWTKGVAGGKQGAWTETKKEKATSSEIDLTRQALRGDEEAAAILEATQARRIEISKAQGLSAIESKMSIIDIPGTAQAILDGRENMENVKNTFGVAVQEAVRKQVLAGDPKFNFNQPRVKLKAVQSSLTKQYGQRGMMGSFVKNIDKQLLRTDEIMKDVISRVGVRAIDLPLRELKTRFVGSGHEKVLEAYLIEISNEIGKLSTGSTASVRELSTEAQERWSKIHDPNLSMKELQIILDETQKMGQMRLESTDEEIAETMSILDNIRKSGGRKTKPKTKKKSRYKILKVE